MVSTTTVESLGSPEARQGIYLRCACLHRAKSRSGYPGAVSTPRVSAQDLRAAAEVHQELGPLYSDAVVDAFLEKVDARIDERVNARMTELTPVRRRGLAGLSSDHRRGLQTGTMIGIGGLG